MGLAKHIGDPKRDDSLTKENVKEVAQNMGVLSTEAAVAQLERAMAAWKAEKTRLKESMLQGVEPPFLMVCSHLGAIYGAIYGVIYGAIYCRQV